MSARTLDAMPTSLAQVPEALVNFGGVTGYLTKRVHLHVTRPATVASKLCAYLFSVALTLPLVLVPLFIMLRADGTITWTWAHTLIPLWVLDAFLLPLYCHFACVDEPAVAVAADVNSDTTTLLVHAAQSPRKILTKVQMLSLVVTITTQILVTLKLDGQLAWKWSYVSLPFCLVMIFDPSITSVLQVLQAVFVAQKLDMELSWSWGVVLLPTWLPAFILTFIVPSAIFANMITASDDNTQPSLARAVALLVTSVVAVFFACGPQMLLVLRLQYAVFDAIYIILPWLVLYAIIVLAGLVHVFAAPAVKDADNVTVTVEYGAV